MISLTADTSRHPIKAIDTQGLLGHPTGMKTLEKLSFHQSYLLIGQALMNLKAKIIAGYLRLFNHPQAH